MARAWTTPVEPEEIRNDAERIIREAGKLEDLEVERTADAETREFISYWFAPRQESALARIATVLRRWQRPTRDALAVAVSRIIVSKERMASLARDTSHSRPHKVADSNDFDVPSGFLRSARYVAARLAPDRITGQADIRQADARLLDGVDDASIDLVLTSPPYLNAIDYLRGHRLALVWLGHELRPLREIRANSVGAERVIPATDTNRDVRRFVGNVEWSNIAARHLGWIRRYASDMDAVLRQIVRVIKRTGQVVLVLGNSFLRGGDHRQRAAHQGTCRKRRITSPGANTCGRSLLGDGIFLRPVLVTARSTLACARRPSLRSRPMHDRLPPHCPWSACRRRHCQGADDLREPALRKWRIWTTSVIASARRHHQRLQNLRTPPGGASLPLSTLGLETDRSVHVTPKFVKMDHIHMALI